MARTGRLTSDGRLQTSNALIGAAIVYLVPAIMYWSIRGFEFDLFAAVSLGGCALLIAMGSLARWTPLAPAIISAAIYALNLAWLWKDVPAWNPISWILHGAIVMLLIIAVASSIRHVRNAAPTSSSNRDLSE